jgi:hypothetical protein
MTKTMTIVTPVVVTVKPISHPVGNPRATPSAITPTSRVTTMIAAPGSEL